MLKKKKGEIIYNSERLTWIYRSVIESVIQDINVYEEIDVINELTKDDVDLFIKEKLDMEKLSISRVLPKSSL